MSSSAVGWFLVAAFVVGILVGRKIGWNGGFNLGYNRGYHQCCKDYDLYEKEGISQLDYFQDRKFEIEKGIYEARELERELKGKRRK